MSIAHLLEDFGALARGQSVEMTDVLLEEERLEAFEKGYQAGWDDSVKAQKDGAQHVSADFAQNLKDLSFTYHEAYAGLLKGLQPLIRQMVDAVLPGLARDMLGAQVTELLQDLVAAHGQQPVLIRTGPANTATLTALAADDPGLPVTVDEDVTLPDGQVEIAFGQVAEHEINLDEVLSGIRTAVAAYFDTDFTEQKETA